MLTASLIVVAVAALVAVAGSHRNLIAITVTVIAGCFGVALATGLVCDALAIPRHEWQAPIILFLPLPVLGCLAVYAGQGEAIGVAEVSKVINDISTQRRRRSSIKADVRRRVNQYKVEVS